MRKGRDKPFDVAIVREEIKLRPVKWEIKDGIGYININQFAAGTGEATEAAITAIDKATGGKPLGYIVDLRSNPGGSLDEAIQVSDAFLDSGEIVSQRGRDKDDIQRYYAKPGDMTHGLPIIVLTDVGSASASEIVAGALQDHRRALIMGERSFGKGSVQSIAMLGDRTALRLTTARYYTPSGHSVQEGGIDPDITVPQLSDPDYKDRPVTREADLRRHLLNQAKVDDKLLESDDTKDPRFTATAAELEKKGIKDFQLYYALNTLKRIAGPVAAGVVDRQEGAISRGWPKPSLRPRARSMRLAGAGGRAADRLAAAAGAARRRLRIAISRRAVPVRDVLVAALCRTSPRWLLAALAFTAPADAPRARASDAARGAGDRRVGRDRRLSCRGRAQDLRGLHHLHRDRQRRHDHRRICCSRSSPRRWSAATRCNGRSSASRWPAGTRSCRSAERR